MQAGSGGIAYGLKYQARCIANVAADSQRTSFLVGTLSLRKEDEFVLQAVIVELFCGKSQNILMFLN